MGWAGTDPPARKSGSGCHIWKGDGHADRRPTREIRNSYDKAHSARNAHHNSKIGGGGGEENRGEIGAWRRSVGVVLPFLLCPSAYVVGRRGYGVDLIGEVGMTTEIPVRAGEQFR